MNEIGVALVIVFVIVFAIASAISNANDKHLIDTGQADYFVKVAASGKGTTYHSLACNRIRGGYMLTLADARSKLYAPCASCGGKPSVRRIDKSAT